ncbi:thiol-activated cytolysin C-terminal domain-containing protein, partial [Enterococcus faecalis]|uniref:thiol-activated cytolysin C-terminal domain-containing protein n=1 Tax=Enterococcus faecalis TaxID=1351 RepID=UPI0025B00FE6
KNLMEESKENILEDSSSPNSKESVSKEELDRKEKNLMEESKKNILEDSSLKKSTLIDDFSLNNKGGINKIMLNHRGAYIVRYYIDWDEISSNNNGNETIRNIEWPENNMNKTAGFLSQILIPANARNINIKIIGATGLVWDPWYVIYQKKNLPNIELRTILTSGTTLSPYYIEETLPRENTDYHQEYVYDKVIQYDTFDDFEIKKLQNGEEKKIIWSESEFMGRKIYVSEFPRVLTGVLYPFLACPSFYEVVPPENGYIEIADSKPTFTVSSAKSSPFQFRIIGKVDSLIKGRSYEAKLISKNSDYEDKYMSYDGIDKKATAEILFISGGTLCTSNGPQIIQPNFYAKASMKANDDSAEFNINLNPAISPYVKKIETRWRHPLFPPYNEKTQTSFTPRIIIELKYSKIWHSIDKLFTSDKYTELLHDVTNKKIQEVKQQVLSMPNNQDALEMIKLITKAEQLWEKKRQLLQK